MNKYNTTTIGIIGGGQLALMLCQAALDLNVAPVVFVESEDCPAVKGGFGFIVGTVGDEAFKLFLSQVNVVLFESENVDCQILGACLPNALPKFRPSLDAMAVLQDKLSQKRMFQNLKIRTPDFLECDVEGDTHWFDRIKQSLGPAFVLKWARFGYDGKGVLKFDETTEPERLESFVMGAKSHGSRVYAESFIQTAHEFAQVSVTALSGELKFYPLVETFQNGGMCSRVICEPRSGDDFHLHMQARDAARRIAVSLGLCGTFAVEFLLDEKGQLFANEIAPRVHNSGHFSLDGAAVSQFENHIRGTLGLGLGSTECVVPTGMLNLIGDHVSQNSHHNFFKATVVNENVFVKTYMYQKTKLLPGRKMGHVNVRVAQKHGVQTPDLHAISKILSAIEQQWLTFTRGGER